MALDTCFFSTRGVLEKAVFRDATCALCNGSHVVYLLQVELKGQRPKARPFAGLSEVREVYEGHVSSKGHFQTVSYGC